MQCDRCEQDAQVHITEIRRGLSYERHLCEKCAEMLLPMEGSEYADYLEVLPPRHSADASSEAEPTDAELHMTGLRQRLVVVDLDARAVTPVGPEKGNVFYPVWSPDSKRLAVCHHIETLVSLVLVEPGTPWQRRFLHTAFAESASWSHDGSRIAFTHVDPESGGILAAEVADGTLHRLPPLPWLGVSSPVFSPRDDRLAFATWAMDADTSTSTSSAVCVGRFDSSERRRAAVLARRIVSGIAWSPDAVHLAAFSTSPVDVTESQGLFDMLGARTLHVFRADAEDAEHTEVDGRFTDFAWVRDVRGAPLVLAKKIAGDEVTSSACMVDPETRDVRVVADNVLLSFRTAEASHLSRDGRTLLVAEAGANGRILLVDVETRVTKRVAPHGEVVGLSWLPDGNTFLALVRTDRAAVIAAFTPEGARTDLFTFDREEYYDVPQMVVSPDGKRAAVEVHLPETD